MTKIGRALGRIGEIGTVEAGRSSAQGEIVRVWFDKDGRQLAAVKTREDGEAIGHLVAGEA